MFEETLRRYPHQDVAGLTSFLADWEVLAIDEGWDRFSAAVKKARMESNFFPQPKEIIDRLPAHNTRPVMAYDEKCTVCHGLGWKNVGPATPSPENPNPKEDRYARCECAHIIFIS